MIQPRSHVRLEHESDAPRPGGSTDVPRAVRAFLRIVALHFFVAGVFAFVGGGAVAFGIIDPTVLLHGEALDGSRAEMQRDIARVARIPMIGGALSVAFGVTLYWASPRLADLISS